MQGSDCKWACVYIQPACRRARLFQTIFGYRSRVVNVKELALKVRHDAALWWGSAVGSCSRCGLDIILVHRAGSSRRPAVLVFTIFNKTKKQKAADQHGQQFKVQFYRVVLRLWFTCSLWLVWWSVCIHTVSKLHQGKLRSVFLGSVWMSKPTRAVAEDVRSVDVQLFSHMQLQVWRRNSCL